MRRKRQNIGRRTNEARKRREKRQKEAYKERAHKNNGNRLHISQSHAIQSSQQCKSQVNIIHLSLDVINVDSVPVIKTEILDPSEQNQEFILPDYRQHVTATNPMWLVGTEIQDSSKPNKFLLPNIKVEQIEIDNVLNESSKAEVFSGSFINSEIENSINFKYNLNKCSVLLHDCLLPQNLTSISAKFKSLRINTEISETSPKVHLFPLSDAPFLPHISEAYKKMAFLRVSKSSNKNKSNSNQKIHPITIRRKKSYLERSKKYLCNCFKATEDAMVRTGGQFYANYSESTQLCSCLTSDCMLSESTDILVKKASLFDPDFGKITCGINKMEKNF